MAGFTFAFNIIVFVQFETVFVLPFLNYKCACVDFVFVREKDK